jgi:FMN phosphatase YigB (HAD superfamily)
MRAKEFQPKKLVIFDIDDTLVHTQTKVHVVKDGQVTKELNSHEFTHYKLQPGEQFDFENFRNAHDFFHKSKPIIPMMNQLKQDIATGNKVVMVTARADFDDRELFLDTFRKYGVDMGKVHVYRAGNMTGKMQTEEKKKIIIRNLLDKGNYTKAIMYDDAVPNLESFVELKDEYPKTKFYAWHVSLEGEAREYTRTDEQQSLEERRKKKRKSRWAAYGPGPYGGYDYYAGYSGDMGGGDGGGESVHRENMDHSKDDQAVPELKAALVGHKKEIQSASDDKVYDIIDKMMTRIAKAHGISGQKLHDMWVEKYGQIPDTWIMKISENLVSEDAIMGKIEQSGKIVRILKKQHSVPFSDEKEWLLIDTDPAKGNKGLGLKWVPANTRFEWVRPYRDTVEENFADGRNPQDKGDSKRHGINTKASVSSLRKTAKQGGRKGQLAHWLANMKAGRAKKH